MAGAQLRREPPREIIAEILLRLPPHEPACLLRAALVCTTWYDAVSDPYFRRRLHELHPTPHVLGFLHNWENEDVPRFIPATVSPFSVAAPDWRFWRALGCRHGRALFLSKGHHANELLLLWDPITRSDDLLPVPPAFANSTEKMSPTAAVFCAKDGCDHRGCHGGPFRLVFVFSVKVHTKYVTSACLYSSETGAWGEATSINGRLKFTCYSSVLVVEKSLLYFMSDSLRIVECDSAGHNLTVLEPPPGNSDYVGRFNIVLAEDGGLGVCQYLYPKLRCWTRNTDAQWVVSRAVYLDGYTPIGGLVDADSRVQVMGFAEEANVVFLNTASGVFAVNLQSKQFTRVCDNRGFCNLIPVVILYTPVPRRERPVLLLSSPSEETGRDKGGEEEKTVDHEHQLFDKGPNDIKEGDQQLEIRDPCSEEVAPGCASMEDKHGHALPSEAQQVTDLVGEDPNSSLNEELVKSTSTTSKDDAGNSKTSGRIVEHAAATSEKDDSAEVLLA